MATRIRPLTAEEVKTRTAEIEELRSQGKPARLNGLGDVVAKVTKIMGIKPCGGCKERQEWLNKKVPFKTNDK